MRELFCLSILFLSLNLNSQCIEYTGTCQADWMGNLRDEVKQRPFNQLRLPGSHDSAAYQINITATPDMEKTPNLNWIRDLAKEHDDVLEIVKDLTLTHSMDIFQQLEQGIRAFDFRMFYHQELREFFLAHSFATVVMSLVMNQIQQFLTLHPQEVLVIELKNDFEHQLATAPKNDDAISMIQSILGEYLIPLNSWTLNTTMTLKNLVEANKRILFVFTEYLKQNYDNVWRSSAVTEYWPNGPNVSRSMATIESYVPSLKQPNPNSLNLVFFTVTPSQDSDIESVLSHWLGCGFPESLLEWSLDMNPSSKRFIRANQTLLSGLNIVSADFFSDDYVQQIIDWN